jgi:hypothetical protein
MKDNKNTAEFKPRRFKALIDEFGYDDGGVASFTFRVQSLEKGKIYEESNPAFLEGHRSGVVIDDNSCWWHHGTEGFKKRFKEIK